MRCWSALEYAALLFACLSAGTAAEFFVSPAGDDRKPGSKDEPVATVERARDLIRELKKNGPLPEGGVTVWLRKGDHLLSRSLDLGPDDSGTPQAPIVYRRLEDEAARILGGRPLKAADFKPVADEAIVNRLDLAARGKVVELDLATLGIQHTGPFPDVFADQGGIVELYCDGRRMPLARYPNDGFMTMKKVLVNGEGKTGGVFEFRDDRTLKWHAAAQEGLWLKGYWRVAWQNEAIRVAKIDPAARTIEHTQSIPGGIGSKYKRPQGSGDERYWALNVLEEIDRPGEWCLHFPSKKLYFWPPKPLEQCEVMVADMDAPLIRLKDASHVQLRGLTLECGLGNAVEVEGGEDVRVRGCTIRNVSKSGVVIKGGLNHGVQSCDLYALGASGVEVSGGDRNTLTPAGHAIVNNHIHHYGEVKRVYGAAINAGYQMKTVGVRIAHNLIHDAPHVGILYGGNENVLEYNEIFRVCLVSNDMGGFYTYGDWTSRGNIVRHNFVHHSPQAHGVYCDDGDSGDRIESNLFYRIDAGVFIGGGHDNIATHNIAVECRKALHLDARGVSRGYNPQNRRMVGDLKAVNYQQPPWSERYPELTKILEFHPELPTGTIFENNVAVNCGKLLNLSGSKEQLQFSTIGRILEYKEGASFVAPGKLDFRLREDAALLKELPGFKYCDFEKIGLYKDEDRTSVPTDAELRRNASVGSNDHNDADPLNAK